MKKKAKKSELFWAQYYDFDQLEKVVYEKLAEKRIKEGQRQIIWSLTLAFLLRFRGEVTWFDIIKQYIIEIAKYPLDRKNNIAYAEILSMLIRQALRDTIKKKKIKNEKEISSLLKDAIYITTNLTRKPKKKIVNKLIKAQSIEEFSETIPYLFEYLKHFGDKKVNKIFYQMMGQYIKNPHMALTEMINETEPIERIIREFYSTFYPRTFLVPNYRRYGYFHGILVFDKNSKITKKIFTPRKIVKTIPKLSYYGIIFNHPKTGETCIETVLDTPLQALQFGAKFYEYEGYSYYINPEFFLPIKNLREITKHYHYKSGAERLSKETLEIIKSNFIIHYREISENSEGKIKIRNEEEEEKIFELIKKDYITPFPWISPTHVFSANNEPIIIITNPVETKDLLKLAEITAKTPFYEIVKTEKIWIHRFLLPPMTARIKKEKEKFIENIKNELKKLDVDPLELPRIKSRTGNKEPPTYPRPSLKNVVNIWWKAKIYQKVTFEDLMLNLIVREQKYKIIENKIAVKTDNSYYRFQFDPETKIITIIQILKGKDPEALIEEIRQFIGTDQFTLFIDKVIMDIEKNKIEQVIKWFQDPTLPGGYSVKQEGEWITLIKRPNTTKIWLFRTDQLKMSIQTLNYIIDLLFP